MQNLILSITAVMICISVHEFAHGYMAYKLGDNTAKFAGRLTLNPLAHFDLFGALMMVFVGFGWAKPVPVNPRYLKNPKRDMILVSLAGPMSNFLLAIFLYVLTVVLVNFNNDFLTISAMFLSIVAQMSIGLGVFNLIPIPPLDGSKIFIPLLPSKARFYIAKNQQYIQFGLMIAIFAGFLSIPLYFLRAQATEIIFKIVDLITFWI